MNNYFISETYAQSSEANSPSNFSPASLVPLLLIFFIFYFLIIRPQTKKIKEHDDLIKNLKIGNKVITSGGIVGIIQKIHEKDNQVELEIADNVVITILKQHISQVEKPTKLQDNKKQK